MRPSRQEISEVAGLLLSRCSAGVVWSVPSCASRGGVVFHRVARSVAEALPLSGVEATFLTLAKRLLTEAGAKTDGEAAKEF